MAAVGVPTWLLNWLPEPVPTPALSVVLRTENGAPDCHWFMPLSSQLPGSDDEVGEDVVTGGTGLRRSFFAGIFIAHGDRGDGDAGFGGISDEAGDLDGIELGGMRAGQEEEKGREKIETAQDGHFDEESDCWREGYTT